MKKLQIQLTQTEHSIHSFSISFSENSLFRSSFVALLFLVQPVLLSKMEQIQLSFLILVFAGIAKPEEFCRTSAQCSNSTYSVCGRAGRVLKAVGTAVVP